MGLIITLTIVAVWAVWVAYTIHKEGKDYPPYQEPVSNTDANWPFPSAKRP